MLNYAGFMAAADRRMDCEYFSHVISETNETTKGTKHALKVAERLIKRGYAVSVLKWPRTSTPFLKKEKFQIFKITQPGIAAQLMLHNQSLFDRCLQSS
jgi:hypothetical protein